MLLAETTAESLEIGTIVMGILGGLALFLYGMDQMADALKLVAGDGMKKVLGKLTTNRFTGLLAGAFVTAIVQSSSVTTVLVVGFISAGLMSLAQSMGVILGADIGTTITAQMVAFKVTKYALLLVTVGFALLFSCKNEKIKHYGHMIMGVVIALASQGLITLEAGIAWPSVPISELASRRCWPRSASPVKQSARPYCMSCSRSSASSFGFLSSLTCQNW